MTNRQRGDGPTVTTFSCDRCQQLLRPRVPSSNMNTSRTTPFATLAAVALLVGLVGCRALPLPIEIDLLAELADARSGVVEETVQTGVNAQLLMDLPEHDDNCIDIDEDVLPVSIVYAQVTYDVDLRYQGPNLRGRVEVQPYLASSPSKLFEASSAFGDPIAANLAAAHVRLKGVARLTAEQVAALNEGHLCWGLRLRGTNVAATADGTIRATYDVRTLTVRAGVAIF
jgi:hypothetical protein